MLKRPLKDYGYSLLPRFTSDGIVKSEKFLKKRCIIDFPSSGIDNDNLAISYVFGSTDTRAYARNMMPYRHVLSVMTTTVNRQRKWHSFRAKLNGHIRGLDKLSSRQ